jgi:dTMP kinase
MNNKMIVIDGVDGSGKGVQTRRLYQALLHVGLQSIITREPGGSPAAEEIRKLLVEGEPEKWDSMTELLLMYAARKTHLNDTIQPALKQGQWVVCDRFSDSSRAFQGIAGELGLEIVEKVHQLVIGSFEPDVVLILDIPESVALERALSRGGNEDRFEKKGSGYQARVRQAFLQISTIDPHRYQVINANQTIDEVSLDIFAIINQRYQLNLQLDRGVR